MPSKRVPAPKPEQVKVDLQPYYEYKCGDVTRQVRHDLEQRYNRATVARLTLEGPKGKASAFLTLHRTRSGWRVEVDHDATDYNTGTPTHRHAGVALRFFGKGG